MINNQPFILLNIGSSNNKFFQDNKLEEIRIYIDYSPLVTYSSFTFVWITNLIDIRKSFLMFKSIIKTKRLTDKQKFLVAILKILILQILLNMMDLMKILSYLLFQKIKFKVNCWMLGFIMGLSSFDKRPVDVVVIFITERVIF